MKRQAPERTCIGCRAARAKSDLTRIVLEENGDVCVDPTGKRPGRGAYLCPRAECVERALQRRALERALKAPVSPEAIERLKTSLTGSTD